MATYLNGTLIADPVNEIQIGRRIVGNQVDALDGTDLLDYTAEKLVFSVQWDLLTAAQYATIMAIVNNDSLHTMAFVPPHTSTSYTVVIKRDTITETVKGLSLTRYAIAMDMEAVR